MASLPASHERKAGRELDAVIAERVMDIPFFNAAYDGLPLVLIEEHTAQEVAAYSTSIAAAWLVVEKMRADGWGYVINSIREGYDRVAFVRGESVVGASGETLPLAICRAALSALSSSERRDDA